MSRAELFALRAGASARHSSPAYSRIELFAFLAEVSLPTRRAYPSDRKARSSSLVPILLEWNGYSPYPTHVKVTLDLEAELLSAALQVAAQRQTTLDELVTGALRREIESDQPDTRAVQSAFETGELGLPVSKRHHESLSATEYQAIIDQIEQEDDRRNFPEPAP